VAAIVLLILFFGVRKLGYQEFAEFARLYRRLGKLKKSFASNITLRKTSAELQRTRSLNEIADLW
jgi:hypothetical protein